MQENLIFCMHYCRLYIGDMVEHMWQSMALSGQYGYDCYVGKDQHIIYTSIAHMSYGKAMAMIGKTNFLTNAEISLKWQTLCRNLKDDGIPFDQIYCHLRLLFRIYPHCYTIQGSVQWKFKLGPIAIWRLMCCNHFLPLNYGLNDYILRKIERKQVHA